MAELVVRSEQRCHGGTIGFYSHASTSTGTEMRFAVYQPPAAAGARLPVLYYLAGLTCTEETFVIKAGALPLAAAAGIILVAPDTSPRGIELPGDREHWDFGVGAGFYVDATESPWAPHYRMYSYVVDELPAIVEARFPASGRRGIFGHSMGGHGALVTALRNPARYQSVSAFAPIANPVAVPWGHKAFGRYLGADRARWDAYDASALLRRAPAGREILVDQGLSDQFLERELHPEALEAAAKASDARLTLRRHAGYDHSYWFIQTFIADHIAWHRDRLHGTAS
ncbi:MAG TPA: S-formylglutathione hydrolase [Kofleriaceae bacterium]|jgi:S-formylglutathione hydrolase|nr:S-formylglutathione hydrolase [Kofleriaceae bacterium]